MSDFTCQLVWVCSAALTMVWAYRRLGRRAQTRRQQIVYATVCLFSFSTCIGSGVLAYEYCTASRTLIDMETDTITDRVYESRGVVQGVYRYRISSGTWAHSEQPFSIGDRVKVRTFKQLGFPNWSEVAAE